MKRAERLTEILDAVRAGAGDAREELFRAVHGELRRLASAEMRQQPVGHTLQTSALVNEAFLRMFGDAQASWEDRAHFFGTAARAMRSILVDMARQRSAEKRGGDRVRIELDDDAVETTTELDEVVAVHDALEKLEAIDSQGAQVIQLRFFAGLDLNDVARVLDVNERTVRRRWDEARAWLFRELSR